MKRNLRKTLSLLIAAAFILVCALPALALPAFEGVRTVPEGYNEHDYQKCLAFLETEDENGVKNGEKLSEDYDPMDPETWGVHMEMELDCIFMDVPTSEWIEVDGELRLEQFRTSQWYGDGLVGALDFSGCTSLVGLVCSGNQLTCVDVSGCSALSELVCCEDGLTELDVSGNASLWRLYCAGNPLSDIDVSNNPNLSQLHCSVTGLTELDVSANPRLYQLYCSGNALTSLDLTANPQIRELTIENNPLKLLIKADQTISAEGNGAFGYRTETLHPMPDVWHYLTAYPDEGAEFLGWYDADGELIGSDLEIEAFNQHEYRARFSGWDEVPEPDGDCNGDGETTVADAILVLRAAMGLYELTEEQLAHVDMDGSGTAAVADAILVLRAAMGV